MRVLLAVFKLYNRRKEGIKARILRSLPPEISNIYLSFLEKQKNTVLNLMAFFIKISIILSAKMYPKPRNPANSTPFYRVKPCMILPRANKDMRLHGLFYCFTFQLVEYCLCKLINIILIYAKTLKSVFSKLKFGEIQKILLLLIY